MPIIHLKHVLIVSTGVSISSDVVRTCSEEGIPLHFISSRGNAIASLYSAGLTGTVLTRRAQLLAYENKRGVLAAKAFVSGKLENQANLLRYIGKYRKDTIHSSRTAYTGSIGMRDFLHELEQLNTGRLMLFAKEYFRLKEERHKAIGIDQAYHTPRIGWWPRTRGATDPFNLHQLRLWHSLLPD